MEKMEKNSHLVALKKNTRDMNTQNIEEIIRDFKIPTKRLSEDTGINYTRFRKCMSQDSYSFTEEEKTLIAEAVVRYGSNIIERIICK